MTEYLLRHYDYLLPASLIAQKPAEDRASSRLMMLDRTDGSLVHHSFRDFVGFLEPGDLLVLNDSRVFPARLTGTKETGGRAECFLLHFPEETGPGVARARALFRSSKPFRKGMRIVCGRSLEISVVGVPADGQAQVELSFSGALSSVLESFGSVPLPPYIRRTAGPSDRERYQTVYAGEAGSVAAPTAGLHFTEEVLDAIRAKGVGIARVTLHVGYGTFAPIRSDDIRDHGIHAEWLRLSEETARAVRDTKGRGGRVVAVGTTAVRALEAAAAAGGEVRPFEGLCDLYIFPGYRFRVVDAMVTNFHLPCSSLLVLVSAFAGRERILAAYAEAVKMGYRFYSYGDAMFIA